MCDMPTYYARAIDTSTGTVREELGPFVNREDAEDALESLRSKWSLATSFHVQEKANAE